MEKKHIIMFTIDYYPNNFGGIGVHVYKIAQVLKEVYDITVVLVSYKEEEFNEIKIEMIEGVNKIHIPIPYNDIQDKYGDDDNNFTLMVGIGYSYYVAEKVERLINFNDKNIILHNHCCLFSVACEYLKDKYTVPLVSTIHFTLWDNKRTLDKTLMNSMMSASDRCIFVSRWLKNDLDRYEKKWLEKEIVIYNGTDKMQTTDNKFDKYLKICFVGSLIYRKGVDVFLNAVSLMKNKNNVLINIVGDGNEECNLKHLAEELKLKVKFWGRISNSNVYDLIRDCNIVVMPSREEPFAIVALETFALGRCLLASNIGGFLELIDDNKTGILFDVENCNSMAEKMDFLYENKEHLYKISQNAHQESSKYSWNSIAKELSSVYEEISSDELEDE